MTSQMKLIGLLGGMSWQSSALYYRLLNDGAHRRLGGHHNARSLLFTLDYDELDRLADAGDWQAIGEIIAAAAGSLERAGADLVLITAVTAHHVAPVVEAALDVPLLHIADPTGRAIRGAGLTRVGLLGTRHTMSMDFFPEHLRRHHGLDVITPHPAERDAVHRVIHEELTLGIVRKESRATLLAAVAGLAARGAEGIVVGCTELPLLLAMEDYPLPAFNVPLLHVEAALDLALMADAPPPTRP